MSNDHTTALVPLQCWTYESPLLRRELTPIDVGLVAEALIYYDRILLVPVTEVPAARVVTQPHIPQESGAPFDLVMRRSFLEFVDWFIQRNDYKTLVSLFSDGVLSVYHYAFYTVPVLNSGKYSCWNMQDAAEENGKETFIHRCLGSRDFEAIMPRARHREKLYRALANRVTEVHASDFTKAVENARIDFITPKAATAAVQSLVDEVQALLPPGLARQITGTGVDLGGGDTSITFDIDFSAITKALAPLEFGVSSPLCGLAHANRLLWSAATSTCDLYLPSPISRLVNTKLVESNERRTRPHQIIETLEAHIDFPDVRRLVNSGRLSFSDVLKIRSRARRFRDWLQTQSERDKDALLAYHHEVTRASGLLNVAGKSLRLFGSLAGAGIGATVGASIAGPPGALTGVAVGGIAAKAVEEGVKFVFDVAGKLDEDWKPIVFGDWMRAHIDKATKR